MRLRDDRRGTADAGMRCLILLLLATSMLIAACGDSDEPTQTATRSQEAPPVTREQYIAKADAFCKKANARSKARNERLQQTAGEATDDDEALKLIAPQIRDGYEEQRQSVRDFQAIEPPSADRAVIDKLWEALEQQSGLLGRLADAAQSRDLARFQQVNEEQKRVTTRLRGLAQGYGFQECGSGRNEAD